MKRLIVETPGLSLREPVDYDVPVDMVTNLYDLATGESESGEMLPHLWLHWRNHYVTSLFITLFKEDSPTGQVAGALSESLDAASRRSTCL